MIDNVTRMVAIEVLCAAQALDLRGPTHAGKGTRAVHALIRQHVPPLLDDRPLAEASAPSAPSSTAAHWRRHPEVLRLTAES